MRFLNIQAHMMHAPPNHPGDPMIPMITFMDFDAPRSQKLIRQTGALESLNAFNDRLLLLRLRRPLF